MAPRVTQNYRTAAEQQLALLVDANTSTITFTDAVVPVSPVSSTGKVFLAAYATVQTGTSPTASVQLQHSWDNVNFFNVGSAVPNVTAINTPQTQTVSGPVGPFVRAVVTMGGTVTACTLNVTAYVAVK